MSSEGGEGWAWAHHGVRISSGSSKLRCSPWLSLLPPWVGRRWRLVAIESAARREKQLLGSPCQWRRCDYNKAREKRNEASTITIQDSSLTYGFPQRAPQQNPTAVGWIARACWDSKSNSWRFDQSNARWYLWESGRLVRLIQVTLDSNNNNNRTRNGSYNFDKLIFDYYWCISIRNYSDTRYLVPY